MAHGNVRTRGIVRLRHHFRIQGGQWALILLLAALAGDALGQAEWLCQQASQYSGTTPEQACRKHPLWENRMSPGYPLYDGTQWKFHSTFNDLIAYFQHCEPGETYNAETHVCDAPPDCSPEAGRIRWLSIHPSTFGRLGQPVTLNVGGCGYLRESVGPDGGCYYLSGTLIACRWGYAGTGSEAGSDYTDAPTDGENSNGDMKDDPFPKFDPFDDTETSNYWTKEQDKTEGNPDGSTTRTEVEKESTIENEGTTVKENPINYVKMDSTGTKTETTTTRETTTNADGSKNINETKNTTKTTPNTDTETVDKATGNITHTHSSGTTTTGQTSSSWSYDASGNLTGSSTTGSGLNNGSGNGTGTGEEGGGGFGGGTAGELYNPTDKTFTSVLTTFKDGMLETEIGQAFDGFFDVSGGGSCEYPTIPATDYNPTIPLEFFCGELLTKLLNIVNGVLLIVASFYAWTVAVDR